MYKSKLLAVCSVLVFFYIHFDLFGDLVISCYPYQSAWINVIGWLWVKTHGLPLLLRADALMDKWDHTLAECQGSVY